MKGKIIFFGAAGSGAAYCQHTKTKPDFFVDNDLCKDFINIITTTLATQDIVTQI